MLTFVHPYNRNTPPHSTANDPHMFPLFLVFVIFLINGKHSHSTPMMACRRQVDKCNDHNLNESRYECDASYRGPKTINFTARPRARVVERW